MKSAIGFALVALLGIGLEARAQPAGVTPEMIASSLPEEGAPKAVPGPYAVATEAAFGNPGMRVYRPTQLDHFPAHDTLPVVVWGNGGCAMDNPRYGGLLSTIASHGFLVLTTANAAAPAAPAASAPAGAPAPGPRATAADLTAAIDWAQRENARAGSPLAGKIDVKKVAVMGQSCGGGLALALGMDPRVGTIGVFNSGAQEAGAPPSAFPTFAELTKLHGPVLLVNGHERDFLMGRSKATFEAINHLPVFYGARHGAGHTATAYHAGGGEFANVASNWVRWQFKGDGKAGQMFRGAKCGLCGDANWDVAAKRMP